MVKTLKMFFVVAVVCSMFTFPASSAYARSSGSHENAIEMCDAFAECYRTCSWYNPGCGVWRIIVCSPLYDACVAP